jgi:DNA-binding MarR family transcriptional regulator
MTNRIDRLEENGLVSRAPDPHDRRGILVALTPKGRKLIDTAVNEHVLKEKELLKPLSASEQKELARLLRKLLIEFDAGPSEPRSSR